MRSRVRTSHAHQAATVASYSGRSEKRADDLLISQRVIDEEEHSYNDEARNYKDQRITHGQLTLSFMKVIFGAALPAANAPPPTSVRALALRRCEWDGAISSEAFHESLKSKD